MYPTSLTRSPSHVAFKQACDAFAEGDKTSRSAADAGADRMVARFVQGHDLLNQAQRMFAKALVAPASDPSVNVGVWAATTRRLSAAVPGFEMARQVNDIIRGDSPSMFDAFEKGLAAMPADVIASMAPEVVAEGRQHLALLRAILAGVDATAIAALSVCQTCTPEELSAGLRFYSDPTNLRVFRFVTQELGETFNAASTGGLTSLVHDLCTGQLPSYTPAPMTDVMQRADRLLTALQTKKMNEVILRKMWQDLPIPAGHVDILVDYCQRASCAILANRLDALLTPDQEAKLLHALEDPVTQAYLERAPETVTMTLAVWTPILNQAAANCFARQQTLDTRCR